MVHFSRQYYPVQSFILFIGESLLIISSILLATAIRFAGTEFPLSELDDILFRSVIIMGACQLTFHYSDLYDLENISSPLNLALRLLQALGAVCIVLAAVYYFIPNLMLARDIFFMGMTLIGLLVYTWRYVCQVVFLKKKWAQRVVILGTGNVAKEVAGVILDKKDSSIELLGFVDKDPEQVGREILNPKVIGTYAQLCSIAEENMPVTVVVALDERRGGLPFEELLACKMKGISVEDNINFLEKLCGKLMVESLNPGHLIFAAGFRKPKYFMIVRRLIDIALSLLGLAIFFPIFLLIGLLIKIDSRGPIFFKQERVGENGRVFKIYKFRSMKRDAETLTGPVWAEENDPRVTRVGKYLRKFRIDEIPQFWNVLIGDMSFIGPRPERQHFVEDLTKKIPYYGQRHSIKPGITGWAQIKYRYGATEGDALEKLKYELFYIKNLSPLLDLIILVETVKIVLFGKGAR